ncbi:site-2 protease family protein [Rhodocaloribacter litoris]|uniref:site-2 protease family protein n=1 Tax=Rhodocaloribacter litoris TaxID=2558931 RepID=UPI001420E064|nr:site-2 protease family protein [Rhodocaloribacter litoris]QXD15115.1 site-2 protease family protein [Rhodocaloribacter litoris]
MKPFYHLGTVTRINIFVHWTTVVMFFGLFLYYLWRGVSLGAALAGVLLIAVVFGCVLLHELGHALAARHFGIGTRDITMYPIGGVARLERIPRVPAHEFWIAVAGPAVNLGLAAGFFVFNLLTGRPLSIDALLPPRTTIPGMLMWVNLLLAGFNLLPAFPMDGGRVLRAWLAARLPYHRATRIAAWIGQAMAILFGLAGLLDFNPVLVFIGLFVFLGARQEVRAVAETERTGYGYPGPA